MSLTVAQAEAEGRSLASGGYHGTGQTWAEQCLAYVTDACEFPQSARTAYLAFQETQSGGDLADTNYSAAPRGAIHWWATVGGAGHVAVDLDGGGSRVMMCTSFASVFITAWANGCGTTSISKYNSTNGSATYKGWTRSCIGQTLSDVGSSPVHSPSFTTSQQQTLQKLAQFGGYTGPVDGAMGTSSWKGVQTVLRGYGYQGPIDGAPGTFTYEALQRLAQAGGYTGPVDGNPGSATIAGVAQWVTSHTNNTGVKGVYGIDVGTSQNLLDFNAARASGYQFAIVKAGGSNASPTYIAPHYHGEVDAARAANLIVGHYWNGGYGYTAPDADANFFVSHLYDYRPGDLLALDNEGIDSGHIWTDTQVALFMTTVKNLLGVTPFHYTTRSILASDSGNWSATRATGSKLWIADPDHQAGSPSIGSYPSWAIHQYSQANGVNGLNTDQDIATLDAFSGFATPPDGLTLPPTGTTAPTTTTVSISASNQMILQNLAKQGGYTGPVDGNMGTASWTGVQTVLYNKSYYSGPRDGVPGTNTYKGIQLLAADYGYMGPIDGVPGSATFAGVSAYLSASSSGVSAPTSAQATTLQQLAQAGGYTGPVDGSMGTNSWKGVQTIVTGFGYTGPQDGSPGTNTYKAMQRWAELGGYTGPIDGALGTASWKGIQTILRNFGYTGPIDGNPGANTYAALQRVARIGGYTGPLDGSLGSFSWQGVQAFLAGTGYTGPIDGAPGTNTYTAMQVLARNGGYVGPLDGIPGTNTYIALQKLVTV